MGGASLFPLTSLRVLFNESLFFGAVLGVVCFRGDEEEGQAMGLFSRARDEGRGEMVERGGEVTVGGGSLVLLPKKLVKSVWDLSCIKK